MTEKKPSPCCQMPSYWDPISAVGFQGVSKRRFGAVVRCSKCHKPLGDVRMDWKSDEWMKAAQNKFNGTSWTIMLDHIKDRPGAPLNFELGSAGVMVPEGYKGQMKVQADFDEVPF